MRKARTSPSDAASFLVPFRYPMGDEAHSRVKNSMQDKGLDTTSKGKLAINDMDVGSIYPNVS